MTKPIVWEQIIKWEKKETKTKSVRKSRVEIVFPSAQRRHLCAWCIVVQHCEKKWLQCCTATAEKSFTSLGTANSFSLIHHSSALRIVCRFFSGNFYCLFVEETQYEYNPDVICASWRAVKCATRSRVASFRDFFLSHFFHIFFSLSIELLLWFNYHIKSPNLFDLIYAFLALITNTTNLRFIWMPREDVLGQISRCDWVLETWKIHTGCLLSYQRGQVIGHSIL